MTDIKKFIEAVEETFGHNSKVEIAIDTKDFAVYDAIQMQVYQYSPMSMPSIFYNPDLPVHLKSGLVSITIRKKTEPLVFKIGENFYDLSEIQTNRFEVHSKTPPVPDMAGYKEAIVGSGELFKWVYDAIKFNGKRYALKLRVPEVFEDRVMNAVSMSGVKMTE